MFKTMNIHFKDKKNVSSVREWLGFSCNVRTFARPKQLITTVLNYKKEPVFPSLADEIAEPRPDMNN